MADIKRTRGDTYPVTRVVKSRESNAVVPITGWTIQVTVSSKPFPADASAQIFTTAATITSPSAGKYQWAPTTANADFVGRMFFGALATKPGGETETLEAGLYTVTEGIK